MLSPITPAKIERKTIMISFSGGLDSTALLDQALVAGHNVSLVHTEVNNLHRDSKIYGERNACIEIVNYYRRKYPSQNIKISMVKMDIGKITLEDNLSISSMETTTLLQHHLFLNNFFIQMPLWLNSLSYFIDDMIDEVWIGLVAGDQDCAIFHIYQEYWNNLLKISLNGKHPPLKAPFLFNYKYTLVEFIPQEVLNMTWTCEGQTDISKNGYVPCKKCLSCMGMEQIFMQYKKEIGESYWKRKARGFKLEN